MCILYDISMIDLAHVSSTLRGQHIWYIYIFSIVGIPHFLISSFSLKTRPLTSSNVGMLEVFRVIDQAHDGSDSLTLRAQGLMDDFWEVVGTLLSLESCEHLWNFKMYKSFFRDSPLQLEFVWIEWLLYVIWFVHNTRHISVWDVWDKERLWYQNKSRQGLTFSSPAPVIPVRSEKFVDGLQKLGFFNAPASLEVRTWYEDIRKDSWWLGGQFRVESGTDAKIKHVEMHNCKGSRFMVGLWEWSCINLSWGLKCHPKIFSGFKTVVV